MAKVCPNCGKELKDTASFCGKCGSKWEDSPKRSDKKPAKTGAAGFVAANKNRFIGAGALICAIILLLVIVNPANSPNAVFGRYLDCLHSENNQQFTAISYAANYSEAMTKEDVVSAYQSRFTSADASYNSGGKVDLLKDTEIKITKVETPKQTDLDAKRTGLGQLYRNTARITDIRSITFEVKQGENKSVGTAELICVTGKWYIADVTGI